MSERNFYIEVTDSANLTIEEIWPDGDAPKNPTVDDVIAQIRKTSSRTAFPLDWGFFLNVYVNGKEVFS